MKLSSYLIGIAYRIQIDHLRRSETKALLYSLDADQNLAHKITTPPEQHELVVAAALEEKVWAAVATLSPRKRMTLEYIY